MKHLVDALVEQYAGEVVAESNGARLIRLADGSLRCECPFACLATYEPCEFRQAP